MSSGTDWIAEFLSIQAQDFIEETRPATPNSP